MVLIPVFIIGLVLLVLIFYFFTIYNGLITVKNNIKKSWANIDVLLMQRSDEIPKLLTTVKGYVKHEKNMINEVLESREHYLGANTVGEKAIACRIPSIFP